MTQSQGGVCQFYCKALTPGKGSDQVSLEPDFPELAEKSTWQSATREQGSTDTDGYWATSGQTAVNSSRRGNPILTRNQFVSPQGQ